MSRQGTRSSRLGAALAALAFVLSSPLLSAADQLVDFDRHIDFTKYRTFAIRGAAVEINRPEIRNSLVTDRASAQVRTALAAHGLRESAEGPDLVVDWSVSGQGFNINPWGRAVPTGPGRVPWHPAAPGASGPESYIDAIFVIDMHDSSSRELVWRGVLRDRQRDAARLSQKLDDYAKKLLSRWPVKLR
jgi:hypothetical protein